MIRFIDENTGNVYNGNIHYVHWFDGKQSIGLNYDKKFIILTDVDHVEIQTNGEIFYLVDSHIIDEYQNNHSEDVERVFNDKTYLDLDTIKTTTLTFDYSDGDGAKVGNFYVYTFNIIAQGKYVGEITDTFTINEENFKIGADFIDENESLGINLANFGAEISNEVQRAIYEAPIDEQKTDYILINRKFKELLNEYINILGNKGSYKSLINSLNWFEYGDLVKIYEYWKHAEPNKNYLSKRDITQIVNEQTEELLYSNAKTTFVGIGSALEKIKLQENEIVYEDKYTEIPGNDPQMVDEPNPDLEKVSMIWSKEEMSLKMVLLGNFFATYFLPIHLDLIHCTIENIVYTNTIKIASIPKIERTDIHDEINDIKCDIEKLYHLKNIETFTNPNTPFGFNHRTNFDETDEALEILGVETKMDSLIPDVDKLKTYALQHFKGIGVLVPIKCTLCNVTNSAVITNASIKVHKYHTSGNQIVIEHTIERDTDNIEHIPVNGRVFIHFNILIREIGNYKVQLLFRRSDGITYIKVFDFEVDGENYPQMSMYKIVPRYDEQGIDKSTGELFKIKKWIDRENDEDDDQSLPFGHIADYVFDPIFYKNKLKENRTIYTQFISATKENIYNTVHTNQVFIIKTTKGNDNLGVNSSSLQHIFISKTSTPNQYLEMNSIISTVDTETGRSSASVGTLDVHDIVWFSMDRGGNFVDTTNENIAEWTMSDETIYLIGINTSPNIDNENCSKYTVKRTESSNVKIWLKDMFIPYFYKLERFGEVSFFNQVSEELTPEDLYKIRTSSDTYTLNKTDVVCFLPELRCLKRPSDFMWKYICKTNNTEITPLLFRRGDMTIQYKNGEQTKISPNDNKYTEKSPFPTILQPLFGRYDFSILPDVGYYDVIFNYKLDDNEEKNQTKTISSQFIISK